MTHHSNLTPDLDWITTEYNSTTVSLLDAKGNNQLGNFEKIGLGFLDYES